jgi:plastocyanin
VEDTHGEGTQEQSEAGEGSEATEVPHGPTTLNGWRDPEYAPGPEATAVPECWSRPEGEQAGGDGNGGPSPSVPAIENPGTADKPRVIRLVETVDLKIKDENGTIVDKLGVKKGETVTFEVTNESGVVPHNFYVGDPKSLEANAKPQLKGIPEFNSGTQSFTWTVEGEGRLQFACTVPGHYPLMHGDFIVVE